jgi:hypothetical protein
MKSDGFVPKFVPDFFKIKGGPMRTALARPEMNIARSAPQGTSAEIATDRRFADLPGGGGLPALRVSGIMERDS